MCGIIIHMEMNITSYFMNSTQQQSYCTAVLNWSNQGHDSKFQKQYLIRCHFHQIYHWHLRLDFGKRPNTIMLRAACVCFKRREIHQLSGELQKERGKFQSQQLSLLTHFNLGKPDVRLPTRDFVGRCKGWSVLETDVRLFFPPSLRVWYGCHQHHGLHS